MKSEKEKLEYFSMDELDIISMYMDSEDIKTYQNSESESYERTSSNMETRDEYSFQEYSDSLKKQENSIFKHLSNFYSSEDSANQNGKNDENKDFKEMEDHFINLNNSNENFTDWNQSANENDLLNYDINRLKWNQTAKGNDLCNDKDVTISYKHQNDKLIQTGTDDPIFQTETGVPVTPTGENDPIIHPGNIENKEEAIYRNDSLRTSNLFEKDYIFNFNSQSHPISKEKNNDDYKLEIHQSDEEENNNRVYIRRNMSAVKPNDFIDMNRTFVFGNQKVTKSFTEELNLDDYNNSDLYGRVSVKNLYSYYSEKFLLLTNEKIYCYVDSHRKVDDNYRPGSPSEFIDPKKPGRLLILDFSLPVENLSLYLTTKKKVPGIRALLGCLSCTRSENWIDITVSFLEGIEKDGAYKVMIRTGNNENIHEIDILEIYLVYKGTPFIFQLSSMLGFSNLILSLQLRVRSDSTQ